MTPMSASLVPVQVGSSWFSRSSSTVRKDP